MLREELLILDRGLIASDGICLRKCVGKGSTPQVDDIEEEISAISFVCWIGEKDYYCSTSMVIVAFKLMLRIFCLIFLSICQ